MIESDSPPSRPDAALLLALKSLSRGPEALQRLAPAWRDRLTSAATAELDPDSARERLRREHQQDAQPDLTRIHPSWWVRALQDESSTIRRAVATHAPAEIRERLRNELEMRRDQLIPHHEPDPRAVACVLALWSEPFVGGPPAGEHDPPIVFDLATLPRHELSRRVAAAGLVKLAAAPGGQPPRNASARIRERMDRFRQVLGGLDDEIVRAAAWDIDQRDSDDLSSLPRVGLLTVARLLAHVEPQRARWATQHLPYATARLIRASASLDPPGLDPGRLRDWETRVWAMAAEATSTTRTDEPGDSP